MKRSRNISLLVLGTAVLLAGCSKEVDLRQNKYASKEDCARDWGDQKVCSPSGGGSGGYLGPRYFWNHSGGAPVAVMPDGSQQVMGKSALARGATSTAQSSSVVSRGFAVSRGGFGGTGRASSGGG